MKVNIDTNVLVSAVLKDRIPEEVILFIASRDNIEWIVSPQIMMDVNGIKENRAFWHTQDSGRAFQWSSSLRRY